MVLSFHIHFSLDKKNNIFLVHTITLSESYLEEGASEKEAGYVMNKTL